MNYAEQLTLDPLHICTCGAQAEQQLLLLAQRFGKLPFFCINDTCDEALDGDVRLRRVSKTLESLLPEPCSFETAYALTAQEQDALGQTSDCAA
jgi:hypothetical protein